MRYCKIYDPVELGRITLRQYFLMTRAIRLQLLDKERDIHAQTWLNQQAKGTKQRGKKTVPYFKNFDEFFPHSDEGSSKKQARNAEQDALREMVLRANMGVRGG